jgi:hypothetical protein
VAAKGSSNLHYFWDGLLGKSTKTGSVLNEATALHSKSFLNYENTTTDPAEWSLESFKIARQAVYLQGELRGSKDKAQAPLLPPDYGRNSKQIAEKCVVLAGYRLAKLLES